MMKRLGIFLSATLGFVGLAQAADLPTTKAVETPTPKPNCWASLRNWLDSSPDDCPLTYAGITAYANIDFGYGYMTNGAPFNPSAHKLAYGIRKFSNGARWAPVYNALSTSVAGLMMKEDFGWGWSLIGTVEAGFNPYSGMLLNPPRSLADNNVNTVVNRSSNFDSSRNGSWDNSQGFVGLSSKIYGTLTFGRMSSLSHDTMGEYDPAGAAAAFSLIGFSGSFPGFGATETTNPNTAFAYRLSYLNFRAAALVQVGGYGIGNASNGMYQGQLGADFGNLSLDGIVSFARDAVNLSTFGGSPPEGYDVNSVLKATLSNNTGVMILAKYKWDQMTLYGGYIYTRYANPSDLYPDGFETISQGIFVPPGQAASSAYNYNRILNSFWIGAKYSVLSNLDLAAAIYYQTQNDYNFTVNSQGYTVSAACAGISTGVSSDKCAGSQGAFSFLADWKPHKRVDVYAGLMVSNVWGGLANGFLHTQNIDPTIGLRVRF